MKTNTTLGWIIIGTGTLFLVSGLIVLIFATLPLHTGGDMATPTAPATSVWVTLADRLMEFTLKLLEVDWTPPRVGIFLIIIGLVLDSGGAYLLTKSK